MTKGKEYFVERLNPVREKLPKRYGTVAKVISPGIDIKRVHSVVNQGTIDWEVLEILKKVVKLSEKAKSKQIS